MIKKKFLLLVLLDNKSITLQPRQIIVAIVIVCVGGLFLGGSKIAKSGNAQKENLKDIKHDKDNSLDIDEILKHKNILTNLDNINPENKKFIRINANDPILKDPLEKLKNWRDKWMRNFIENGDGNIKEYMKHVYVEEFKTRNIDYDQHRSPDGHYYDTFKDFNLSVMNTRNNIKEFTQQHQKYKSFKESVDKRDFLCLRSLDEIKSFFQDKSNLDMESYLKLIKHLYTVPSFLSTSEEILERYKEEKNNPDSYRYLYYYIKTLSEEHPEMSAKNIFTFATELYF